MYRLYRLELDAGLRFWMQAYANGLFPNMINRTIAL